MKTNSAPTPSRPSISSRLALALLLATAALLGSGFLPQAPRLSFELPLLWPEAQRAFLQDGPGLLLAPSQVEELVGLDAMGRQAFIERFLADPLPATPENELRQGIDGRRALVLQEYLSFLDVRSQLLFLNGPPERRELIDCSETFKPMELWTYPLGESGPDGEPLFRTLVLYQQRPDAPWEVWLPIDSKRRLYTEEMEYWLEQWEELRITGGRRFDYQICPRAIEVDRVTGVDGLFGFEDDRPKNEDFSRFLEPPSDLAAWAAAAAADPLVLPPLEILDRKEARAFRRLGIDDRMAQAAANPADSPGIVHASPDAAGEATDAGTDEPPTPTELPPLGEGGELEIFFPEEEGQRMRTRMLVSLPPEVPIEAFPVGEDKEELRLVIEGHLERQGKSFDRFRLRYLLPPPAEGVPVALAVDQLLRPGEEFLVRLRVTDEISGLTLWLHRGFVVPSETTDARDLPPVPDEAIAGITEELKEKRIEGYDSLILVPPETDVVFGLWRAEALVTGQRIESVVFSLDDQVIMTRRRPPFTAELRLETYPKEQIVRAEGLDEDGELVAADEVVLNQPRGELRVRILDPPRGRPMEAGPLDVRAEVVVPEEAKVAKVEFSINEDLLATVTRPPWEARIEMPSTGELVYITAVAELEDGTRAEDVRFLNAPGYIEEVDVNLVELYTTVTDKAGLLIRDLEREDFEIYEDGRPQEIAKFELVENLPLTVGLVLDTSGSMFESLAEAQLAASGFLENIITPRDRVFAVAFADKPALLMPRTSDVGAVQQRLDSLLANGATALHDALVTSLYYFRGVKGRRALVLLSDGEDTSSTLEYREALEYAKRSGVAVYAIGLKLSGSIGVRRKLQSLAEETGGRTFFIKRAEELSETYAEIERELRSQYLLAYGSDEEGESGEYHEVEVKVKRGKLEARTIRGYYS